MIPEAATLPAVPSATFPIDQGNSVMTASFGGRDDNEFFVDHIGLDFSTPRRAWNSKTICLNSGSASAFNRSIASLQRCWSFSVSAAFSTLLPALVNFSAIAVKFLYKLTTFWKRSDGT